MTNIRVAAMHDQAWLAEHDPHVSPDELVLLIAVGRILVFEHESGLGGWLRWSKFWDEIPFINMLFITEEHRGQGHARALVHHWERDVRQVGHRLVMTSTVANEEAQRLYRHLGYKDAGSLLLDGERLEILFTKKLK